MRHNITLRYTLYGALFGLVFPVTASLILILEHQLRASVASLLLIHRESPILWIIDLTPVFFGLFAYLAGVRQSKIQHLFHESQGIFDNMLDGVLILDNQNCIVDVNPAACDISGKSKSQVVGQPVQSILPDWPESGGLGQFQTHWETTIGAFEKTRIYDVRLSPFFGHELVAGSQIAVMRDITELKQGTGELTAILEAIQAFSTIRELESTIAQIALQLVNALNVDGCTLYSWDKRADSAVTWMQVRAGESKPGNAGGVVYPLAEYPALRDVLEKRQPLNIRASDPDHDPPGIGFKSQDGALSLLFLPLAIGERAVGLIEIDQHSPGREFTEREIQLARALAVLAALGIENSRLHNEAQASFREAQDVYRQYLQRGWAEVLHSQGSLEYAYEDGTARTGSEDEDDGPIRTLQVPIKLREQRFGTLTLEASPANLAESGAGEWSQAELALIEAVTDQAAQALENARLIREAQRRAERERLASSISGKVWASRDIETILRDTLQELGSSLGASEGMIKLEINE